MIMQRRVAGCARAVALLATRLARPTSRVARSHVYAAQQAATCCRLSPAQAAAHVRIRSWRIGSQLIHASPIATQPLEPADGSLDHDVDVLVEGVPLSPDWCAAESTGTAPTRMLRVRNPGGQRALITRVLRHCRSSGARRVPSSCAELGK